VHLLPTKKKHHTNKSTILKNFSNKLNDKFASNSECSNPNYRFLCISDEEEQTRHSRCPWKTWWDSVTKYENEMPFGRDTYVDPTNIVLGRSGLPTEAENWGQNLSSE